MIINQVFYIIAMYVHQLIFFINRRMPISQIQLLSQIADFLPFLMDMEDLSVLNSVRSSSRPNLRNKLNFKQERISG